MARRKRPMTLTELAYVRLREKGHGPVKSMRLASDILMTPGMLAIAKLKGAAEDGGWPTQREYAEFWDITERQAQRHWAAFVDLFPEWQGEGPEPVARLLLQAYADRLAQGEKGDLSVAASAPASILGLA